MSKHRQIGFEGGMKVSMEKKEIYTDLPYIKKWVKSIKSIVGKENFKKNNIEYFYACSFNVPTDPEELSLYLKDAEYATTLIYNERVEFEISKLVINVYVKYNSLIISDKILSIKIPPKVKNVVEEIVKVKMMVEYEIHGIDEIKETIPPLDTSKVDMSHIHREIQAFKNQIDEEEGIENENENYDTDAILDKISKYGINSISKKELDFLNKQSGL